MLRKEYHRSLGNGYFERRPLNSRHVKPRKINFKFGDDIPRLWLNNSIVMTNFFNGVNLYLPALELFMVRIMRQKLSYIKSEHLKQQIRGFIGQEISHSQIHRQYNQVLESQGYKFKTYLKCVDFVFIELLEKKLGANISLATIAGFEHLTAMLTDIALNHNLLKDAMPIMKELWEWHAAEEVEHQHLAFELLQTVNNSYWLRILGIILGAAIIVGFTFSGMFVLVFQERGFISRRTLVDLYDLVFGKYKLVFNALKLILSYFQPTATFSHNPSVRFAEKVFTPVS